MNYEEFRRQLGKAGLTVSAFAEMINMNKVSLSNYRNKNVPSHLAIIATLLGAMADGQTDFRNVLSNADIERKKPRGAGFEKCVDVKDIGN
ncbi:helix-turn-helix domain-containing protein [Janthinobacterium aquaticum]|uniref:helix-turn-helix domain-containing protein n=1 Tax=Janthinobacterium sp. FT58W TaxID=2654254 RepID=UPI001264E6D2|nr:helix-turn-helix transcriptional regulator [Janthinobacterium sp. FT58W]KAB8041137.1 XRE family transcriptional regulator [Janthinobacterium sp. FT58W]